MSSPRVGRDGTLLAYATNRRNGVDFDIVARDLRSGEEQAFELGGWCDAAGISPDGRWIAAERLGARSGDSDLFLVDVETGEVVHATPHEGEAEFGRPAWLPDSTHLVFSASVTTATATLKKAFVSNVVSPPARLSAAKTIPMAV